MSRRFSHSQLYALRNHIPIRYVIESLLSIPSETVEGLFRFRCPLCAGYHTAIKHDTNLSRCFQCAKNFNAIDLCMLVRQTSFVESVNFLIEHKKGPCIQQSGSAAKGIDPCEPIREKVKEPVALKDILPKLIGKGFERGLKGQPLKKELRPLSSIEDIDELEHLVHALSQIINRLKNRSHLR